MHHDGPQHHGVADRLNDLGAVRGGKLVDQREELAGEICGVLVTVRLGEGGEAGRSANRNV